jgi:Patatin-like phospholipase
VYSKLSKEVSDIDRLLAGYIPINDDRCRFDFNKLEKGLKQQVYLRLKNEDYPMSSRLVPQPDDVVQCRTFVVAKSAVNVNAPPTLFRSYSVEGERDTKCTIWQAARATTAAPTFFKPMIIENPQPPIVYIDGGMGNNNPALLTLRE